jgi:hypothetical protein
MVVTLNFDISRPFQGIKDTSSKSDPRNVLASTPFSLIHFLKSTYTIAKLTEKSWLNRVIEI